MNRPDYGSCERDPLLPEYRYAGSDYKYVQPPHSPRQNRTHETHFSEQSERRRPRGTGKKNSKHKACGNNKVPDVVITIPVQRNVSNEDKPNIVYNCVLVQILLLTLSLITAIILARWVTLNTKYSITEEEVQIFMIFFLALALIGMFIFCARKFKEGHSETDSDDEDGEEGSSDHLEHAINHAPRRSLIIDHIHTIFVAIGALVFGTCDIISSVLEIVDPTDSIWFRVFLGLEILLCFFEMFTLFAFRERKCTDWLEKICIMVVLLVNFTDWLYIFFEETHGLLGFNTSTTIDGGLDTAVKALTPFKLEFSLLVAGIVGTMWSVSGEDRHHPVHAPPNNPVSQSPPPPGSPQVAGYRTPRLGRQRSYSGREHRGNDSAYTVLVFILSVGMVLILMMLKLLQFYNQVYVLDILYIYSSIAFGISTLVCWMGIRIIPESANSAHKFQWNSEILLLVISNAGIFLRSCLSVLGGVVVILEGDGFLQDRVIYLPAALVSKELLRILYTLSQTILLVHLSHRTSNITKKGTLILIFLGTANFGFWVEGLISTIRMEDMNEPFPIEVAVFGGGWDVLASLLYPFSIFYNFHCILMTTEIMSYR